MCGYLFMKFYFKLFIYLLVFTCFSIANAGSYDDFFTAVRRNDPATVSALIKRGFDVNTLGPEGETGLLVAVRASTIQVIDVLVRAPKIKVESRSAQDESPLMLAAINGLTEVCKQLISLDADVNKSGWTPLHYAATKGHLDIINLLLENHAYIDAESPNGTTPLMMAAEYGTPQAVTLLLNAGADPLAKNLLGLMALDFATRAERPDAVQLIKAFLKAMPDRHIPDVIIR